MRNISDNSLANEALQNIAEKLDLDNTRYEKADQSYKAVSAWLDAENSLLHKLHPEMYSQGSFRLGTVAKPLDGDFDLDFVCLFTEECGLDPYEAYSRLGDRLRQNQKYADMLEAKNRCWRLNYAGDFHMDVIPAIPDGKIGGTAIKVPDRNSEGINKAGWTKSNPKGFSEWLGRVMSNQYELQKHSIESQFRKSIEEIPEYFRKTELQQAIQLLKRHRDVMFQGDKEKDKPISIIITTLAGRVYEECGYQGSLFQLLILLANEMENHIHSQNPKIPNPLDSEEDFADKWRVHHEREIAFYQWALRLRIDLEKISTCSDQEGITQILEKCFQKRYSKEKSEGSWNETGIQVSESGRFNVEHKAPLQWPEKICASVRVEAIKKSGVTKGVMPKPFYHNSNHLEKGLSLEYTAITAYTGNYEVQWQVVNTGREATEYGQLRGKFYSSSGWNSEGYYRKESTKYSGMHWVEAFIITDGICIARSGEFVINIQ